MITSLQNESVKQLRKLHKRKERERSGTFLIEGFHLIEEAHYSGWEILDIFTLANIELPKIYESYPVTLLGDKVFNYVAQTTSPQGIVARVKMNEVALELSEKIILVDAIQEPGNLGTVIRTADAAGFSSVILGDNTVDPFNDKAIRATQGSLFHVSLEHQKLEKTIPLLQEKGYTVWGSALKNAEVYTQIKPSEKMALIVGNEGAGIQEPLLEIADSLVYIPIHGKAESLNVSVAAGVLMYYINS